MIKCGVIILCRYNSRRLPGKILLPIGDKPILRHIVDQIGTVFSKESIIVATSEEISDDPIVHYCQANGINFYRGNLTDVAGRFLSCGLHFQMDYMIRINGDNFFINTPLLLKTKEISETGKYDFVSNVKDRTYPKGMSLESVRLSYFKEAYASFRKDKDMIEHVTLYLYQNPPENVYYFYNNELPEAAGIQLAIDTLNDFEQANLMYHHLCKIQEPHGLKEIFQSYYEVKYT